MFALTITASPAAAADSDALNVGFSGSFVGTSAYTTTRGEIMHGALNAVTGDEAQVAGGGVTLAGGEQGVHFAPDSLDLGSAEMTQGFLAELEFAPSAAPADLATLFSADGNFFVRASSGKLQYGFDSVSDGIWTQHRATAAYPAVGADHVLSLQYLPGDTSTELHVSLDGTELTTVSTSARAAVNAAVANRIGIGNDVHPAGLDRGFVGTVSKARVAAVTGAYSPNAYEFQPKPVTTDLLDVSYGGVVKNGMYTATPNETLDGTLASRTGSESVSSSGAALAGGKQGLDFTASDPVFGDESLDTGFVVETAFTPAANQGSLATLVAVGGNLFARYQDGSLRYGFSAHIGSAWKDFIATTAVPTSGEQHTLSLAYVPGSDSTRVIAWLDGKELSTVTGTAESTRSSAVTGTLSIGNEFSSQAPDRGFSGTVQKTRFAVLNGGFQASAFTYQSLTSQTCDPITLDPANYITVTSADCDANILAKSTLVRPTDQQLSWQELRLTAFVHFGINTFYNQEWGNGTEDPARFDPTGPIDADAWVKQLRDAGFRQAILVVKHHDGFLLYPSRYTDYSVASSPWEDGKGDVLRDFTNAAKKYGMKVGVYLSPADSHEENIGVYGNGSTPTQRTIPTLVAGDDRAGKAIPTFSYQATDYGAYFLNLLYEVLTEYGTVNEVWFDGSQGNTTKDEIFDYGAFYDLIHKLQPNAVIAVGGRDVRWVGNEQGIARDDEWGVLPISDAGDGGLIKAVNPSSDSELGSDDSLIAAVTSGQADKLHWWPAEADMKLTAGWFAHPGDQPKSPSSLLNSFQVSTGHNGIMLLNVPPTTDGSFAGSSVTAIDGFAADLRKTYTKDNALGIPATTADGSTTNAITDGNSRTSWASAGADPSSVTIDLGSAQTVNTITLSEDTSAHGQSVEHFTVDAEVDGAWKTIAQAGTIGVYRSLSLGSAVTAQKFRVSITKARGVYSLANVSLYQTLTDDPGRASDVYLDCSAPTAGDGSSAKTPFNSLEQFRQTELAPGATVHVKSGTDCAASSTPFWGYGTDQKPITVTTYGGDEAPHMDGTPLAAVLAPLAQQGWVIDLPTGSVSTPTIALDASSVAAGGRITARLDGFSPNSDVTLTLHSDPVQLATGTTDAAGHLAITTTIPADTAAGAHEVVATQGDASASASLTVTAAEPAEGAGSGAGRTTTAAAAGDLATTGSNLATPLALALIALIAGAAALVLRRRARKARTR
jgi:alpha-L-fucosidase